MSARPEERPVAASQRPKTTVLTFAEKRRRGEKLTMLTAYDYPGAKLVDEAGVDAILVGDSLAMVVLGHPNTLSVTMDEMLHHARAVSRGASRALLIGDMPFMSYQADSREAVRNAGRFLQEAGMDAVKLEGGRAFAETARAIVRAGIPVMGHVGLTPQSVNVMGGWRVQARTADSARALFDDALALQEAGCFAVVLESVPQRLAGFVTERLEIPTIGIGAGPGTSGQVLVLHDMRRPLRPPDAQVRQALRRPGHAPARGGRGLPRRGRVRRLPGPRALLRHARGGVDGLRRGPARDGRSRPPEA